MRRRTFLMGSLSATFGGLGLKWISERKNMENESTQKMPTLFFGHGSPMNAIEANPFTDFLQHSSAFFPRPKAILVISAHWETRVTKVLRNEKPKTIHDFGGFPNELYRIEYPAQGSLKVADDVLNVLSTHHPEADSSWGLDHGTWTILKYIYPKADIPVLQLSLNQNLNMKEHFQLAQSLKPLRDEGVLIMGSGNITHNLRQLSFDPSPAPVDWAVEFDEMVKMAIINRDIETLTKKKADNDSLWKIAHPHLDHYLPLLYAVGASDENEKFQFLFEGMQMGSLSMRSVMFG